jgi:hypothetical protein
MSVRDDSPQRFPPLEDVRTSFTATALDHSPNLHQSYLDKQPPGKKSDLFDREERELVSRVMLVCGKEVCASGDDHLKSCANREGVALTGVLQQRINEHLCSVANIRQHCDASTHRHWRFATTILLLDKVVHYQEED